MGIPLGKVVNYKHEHMIKIVIVKKISDIPRIRVIGGVRL